MTGGDFVWRSFAFLGFRFRLFICFVFIYRTSICLQKRGAGMMW